MIPSLEFSSKTCADVNQQLFNKALSCICLLLCLWGADCSSKGVNYSEIAKLGSSCQALDRCSNLRTEPRRLRPWGRDRNCNCDPSCTEYGDCCFDAPPTPLVRGRNDLKCIEVDQIGGVYMKGSCPPTSNAGPSHARWEDVRHMCERTDTGDQADPLASLPVTDPLSGLTYKNFYCNLCNGDANDVVMWTPRLECPLLSLLNKSGAITPAYVLENIATDGRNWGLYLNDEGEEFFHDCHVYAVLPARLERVVRPCIADLVSACPPSWRDVGVEKMCESYAGARFDSGGNGYRNAHCAICNGVNVSELSCRPTEEPDIFRDFGTHSFALLLDVSESSGDRVGRVRRCGRGEVFDPFIKKCRGVSCLPGFVRRGRRCVVRNPIEFVKFHSSRKATTSTSTTSYLDVANTTSGSETPHYSTKHVNATLRKT